MTCTMLVGRMMGRGRRGAGAGSALPVVLLAALLVLLALPGAGHAGALPITAVRDAAYTSLPDGTRLTYHLYRPVRGAAARPAIIMLHGGGWWRGSKADLTDRRPLAQAFARRGFVAISGDYRLTCGTPQAPRSRFGYDYTRNSALCGVTIEQQVQDVQALVRHVRANARTLGVDPGRIALLGVSAGGHLALLSAVRATSTATRVQAVVNVSGPPSVEFVARQRPRPPAGVRNIHAAFTNAVGCLHASCPRRWNRASPWTFVTPRARRFPVLGIAGARETQVPIFAIRSFDRRLEGLGWRSDVLVGAGTCHGTECLLVPPATGPPRSSIQATSAFLVGTMR